MLARARSTNLYDLLAENEITCFLAATPERFDLVASTDVLIYVGDLLPVFTGLGRVLRPGGRFAFTVERHDGEGFILHTAARYAHSLSYLWSMATRSGFQVEFVEDVSPRLEGQK